ncbi:MAG: histidine phosphatase family protein, partial [Acutalibacter sp.]
MKLYVTRHGQTAWNRENIVCGVTDLPLDETGMEQARETARKLKDTPIDRVIVSPLLRARQTAALICEGRDLPVMIDPRIKEQNYGVYEGVSRFDEGFLNNKKSFAIHYPGGESQMSTAARVYAFLEDIAQKYPEESVLLVCHGGICRIIESYFHDMTTEAFFQFNAGNCQVREYELDLPQREREGSVTF